MNTEYFLQIIDFNSLNS